MTCRVLTEVKGASSKLANPLNASIRWGIEIRRFEMEVLGVKQSYWQVL